MQYELEARNAGTVTVDQFLDLNQDVGGYGIDANFKSGRTMAAHHLRQRTY